MLEAAHKPTIMHCRSADRRGSSPEKSVGGGGKKMKPKTTKAMPKPHKRSAN